MLCRFHFTFQDKVIEYFQYDVNSAFAPSFVSKIPVTYRFYEKTGRGLLYRGLLAVFFNPGDDLAVFADIAVTRTGDFNIGELCVQRFQFFHRFPGIGNGYGIILIAVDDEQVSVFEIVEAVEQFQDIFAACFPGGHQGPG